MRAIALRLGAASLSVMVLTSGAMAQRMERGAFLRKPADSRAQLLAQVRTDPIVAARYRKHFAMTDEEVRKYFSGMKTGTLPATGRYLVWHVDPDGKHETKWLNLKKGTRVFMDKNGRVALKLNCGNPMIDQTVAKRTIEEPRIASNPPKPVEEVTFVPTPPQEVALVPPPAVVVPEVMAVAPPEVMPLAVVPPPIVSAPPVVARGGGAGFPWPLLLLGGAFVGGGGGGGGGSTPPPVPEPSTMLALGVGAALVVARRKKRAQAL